MTIDIKLTSDGVIEHNRKQYKPVAIRLPKMGEIVWRGAVMRTIERPHGRVI